LGVAASDVLTKLSFSHISEPLECDTATKRAFLRAGVHSLTGPFASWKRQIGSLYYERSGLSKDKEKLATLAQQGAERAGPTLAIRDPTS
jgi:predicted nuclease of restriction endonuclease-like (RecB) superfamily